MHSLCRWCVLACLGSAVLVLGCSRPPNAAKNKPAPQPVVTPQPNAQPASSTTTPNPPLSTGSGGAGGGVMSVLRVVNRQQALNDLRTVGQFYKTYQVENNRGPKTAKEFADYIRRDAPQIAKAIDEQDYVIVTNIRPNSNTIIAYTKQPEAGNIQVIVKGDGSVDTMNSDQLKAAVPQQK